MASYRTNTSTFCYFVVVVWDRVWCHLSWPQTQLHRWKITLNSDLFLCLPSVTIVYLYTMPGLFGSGNWSQVFMYSGKALYQQSYISRSLHLKVPPLKAKCVLLRHGNKELPHHVSFWSFCQTSGFSLPPLLGLPSSKLLLAYCKQKAALRSWLHWLYDQLFTFISLGFSGTLYKKDHPFSNCCFTWLPTHHTLAVIWLYFLFLIPRVLEFPTVLVCCLLF